MHGEREHTLMSCSISEPICRPLPRRNSTRPTTRFNSNPAPIATSFMRHTMFVSLWLYCWCSWSVTGSGAGPTCGFENSVYRHTPKRHRAEPHTVSLTSKEKAPTPTLPMYTTTTLSNRSFPTLCLPCSAGDCAAIRASAFISSIAPCSFGNSTCCRNNHAQIPPH